MTADEIIRLVTSMPGAVAVTASEAGGAPESAWGDTFFFHDPDGDEANRRMPFATLVITDYDGFDTASNLNRPDVFRLNIGVGRELFTELIGHSPAAHAAHQADYDYAALDRVLPHPVYASQSWVCVLNPGAASSARARALLSEAHRRARERHQRRS
ncbi:MAG: DUF6194 family protein [Solirubrobacteraceae bacterium]